MSEPKTKPTTQPAEEFLDKVTPDWMRDDSFTLLELFRKATELDAVMWGSSIVGFGSYILKSANGKQESVWPLVAFSPRKQSLTLYISMDNDDNEGLYKKLGKHRICGSCLYIKKLSDIDQEILFQLIKKSFEYWRKKYKLV